MLMRTDPFRELDRLTQQVFGTSARPAFMPMDAWREGDAFHIEFDLPGVNTDSIDLDVERNVLTVRADRSPREGTNELSPPSVRVGSSAASSSWGTTLTSTGSRPATPPAC